MVTATQQLRSTHGKHPEPVWIKNILFLTDFSSISSAALQYALSVARRFEAKIYVTHIVEPLLGAPRAAAYYESRSVRESAEKELGTLLNEGKLDGVLHEVILSEGALWPSIQQIIKEKQIDVIVLGTDGRAGLRKMFLGSIAEEVYRRANCPVLTIGPEAPVNPEKEMHLHEVLLATDLKDGDHAAADYAISVAWRHGAGLKIVRVIENEETDFGRAEQQRLGCLARLQGMVPPEIPLVSKPDTLVTRGKAAPEILRVANENKVDLIVVGLHGGKRMAGHLAASVAYQVVCGARCPVLTVPSGTLEH